MANKNKKRSAESASIDELREYVDSWPEAKSSKELEELIKTNETVVFKVPGKKPILCFKDDRFNRGYRVSLKHMTIGESKTQQHNKLDCDINHIVAKHKLITSRDPEILQGDYINQNFEDYSNVPNLQEYYEIVENASQSFKRLDPEVREELKSPRGMIEFCQNPKNRERAIEIGLIDKPVENKPVEVTLTEESLKKLQTQQKQ